MSDDQNTNQSGTVVLKGKTRDFTVKIEITQKYPELMQLILNTESMTDEEREYWFQILPVMNDEQVQRLFNILDNEKKQLDKLDQKYNKEIKKVEQEEAIKYQEEESIKKREERQQNEQASEAQEKTKEEELLASLEDID